MSDELNGKTIAIIAADGVEQVEFEQPRDAVQQAGATTELISLESGEIQAMNHDIEPGDTFAVDKVIEDARVEDYDALILPGGVANPDNLRVRPGGHRVPQRLLRHRQAGRCDLSRTVDARRSRSRPRADAHVRLPSIRTDIRNAGGNVRRRERSSSTRAWSPHATPDDLPAFCAKIVEEFAEGKHEVATEGSDGRLGAGPVSSITKGESHARNLTAAGPRSHRRRADRSRRHQRGDERRRGRHCRAPAPTGQMMASTEMVGSGVHRIADGVVNWYLIEDSGEVALVDAGWPRSWPRVEKALSSIGRSPGRRHRDRVDPRPSRSSRRSGARPEGVQRAGVRAPR